MYKFAVFYGWFTTSWNDYAAINGLKLFLFIIYALKIIVNVSAILFVLSNQFTNIYIGSNVINVVLPSLYTETDIV